MLFSSHAMRTDQCSFWAYCLVNGREREDGRKCVELDSPRCVQRKTQMAHFEGVVFKEGNGTPLRANIDARSFELGLSSRKQRHERLRTPKRRRNSDYESACPECAVCRTRRILSTASILTRIVHGNEHHGWERNDIGPHDKAGRDGSEVEKPWMEKKVRLNHIATKFKPHLIVKLVKMSREVVETHAEGIC